MGLKFVRQSADLHQTAHAVNDILSFVDILLDNSWHIQQVSKNMCALDIIASLSKVLLLILKYSSRKKCGQILFEQTSNCIFCGTCLLYTSMYTLNYITESIRHETFVHIGVENRESYSCLWVENWAKQILSPLKTFIVCSLINCLIISGFLWNWFL